MHDRPRIHSGEPLYRSLKGKTRYCSYFKLYLNSTTVHECALKALKIHNLHRVNLPEAVGRGTPRLVYSRPARTLIREFFSLDSLS